MSSTMKAVRFHEYGPPEVLKLETVEIPQPAPGEVLIKVTYAGVNPVDWKFRSGMLKDWVPLQLPSTPGIDVSGTVVAVGQGVTSVRPGQGVIALARGGYAEWALAPAADVVAKPDSLSFDVAATLGVGSLTAWQQIHDAGVSAGQTVVVQGGAGGVGLWAVQLAKQKGARVIATASTPNVEFVRSLGADQVIDYRTQSVADLISNADVVLDTVGGDTLEQSYGLLKKGGILVTVAGHPSAEKAASLGIRALASNRGPAANLAAIAEAVAQRRMVAAVGPVFPLSEAVAAHTLSQSGHGRGRILLKI